MAATTTVTGCSSASPRTSARPLGAASTSPSPTSTSSTSAGTVEVPTTQAGGTIAAGTLACGDVTGSLTFEPPLATGGTSAETTHIALNAGGCTTSASTLTVTSGAATATISSTTNNCVSLLSSKPVAVATSYTPSSSSVHASVVTFSGYSVVNSPTDDIGFRLPDSGGTASVAGSFSGTDHGASSAATVYSTMTATEALAACSGPGGLGSLAISSGTVILS